MYRPDTVVIGAQRAGTTMLLAALAEHPQVEAVRGELHDFSDPTYGPNAVERVSRRFRRPDAVRRTFKCASYLGQSEVPARLASDLEHPDVVAILRDPVTRAVSAWYWYVYVGLVPPESHESALRRLLRNEAQGHAWRHGEEVLEWGLYGRLLEMWLSAFPREKIHVLTDLDMKRDGVGVVRGLYAALGLDSSYVPSAPMHSYNRGVRSLSRLRWLRLRNRWTWREAELGHWSPSRPARPLPALGHLAVHGIDRMLLAPLDRSRRSPLSQELELELWRYYEDDVARLEKLFDIDLSAWRC